MSGISLVSDDDKLPQSLIYYRFGFNMYTLSPSIFTLIIDHPISPRLFSNFFLLVFIILSFDVLVHYLSPSLFISTFFSRLICMNFTIASFYSPLFIMYPLRAYIASIYLHPYYIFYYLFCYILVLNYNFLWIGTIERVSKRE